MKLGRTYELLSDVKTLCCDTSLRSGEPIVLVDNQTPNRVRVKRSDGSDHRLKRSAFGVAIGEVGKVVD